MRRHLLFCALGALLGCRTVAEPSGQAIALYCSTYEGVKTETLKAGEEVAVFACAEGTEDYFLEAAKFIVGSGGRSLTYGSMVYYPDPKQAVRFWAYFPYHTGVFSVPTDQSTATALKEADLCGAVARTTPVATPVALEFKHLMARLVITTKEPTEKISFPNAVASGVLHAATAELVLGAVRAEIWTTGNELIVPVQPLSRLVLTVANVEYVFDTAPIALQAGQTTTLNLTLHPSTKTATLSGSSVTDWVSSSSSGNLSQAVSNVLTIHWAPTAHPLSSVVDRIVCTINGTDYAVSDGITYANDTFTVPFASSTLRYPYTITKISFYQSTTLAQSCTNLLGGAIYKSGASTIGIKDAPINSVKIGNLIWATGNLVASNAAAGAYGRGGCRIGAPADGGLYFQFGSLIGYKGGNQDNGGTGVGIPQAPLTTNGTFWDKATVWSWDNEAMVWPNVMTNTPTAWPQDAITNQWYFGQQAGWSTAGKNIRDFPNLATGGLANVGVGDPCTYYLGGTWRLPTTVDYKTMCNGQGGYDLNYTWKAVGGSWTPSPITGGNFAGDKLFFSASGFRDTSNGSFYHTTRYGFGWSSSVGNGVNGFYLYFIINLVVPESSYGRSSGFPVRCVSN